MKATVAALLILLGVTCLASSAWANPYEELRRELARARSQSKPEPVIVASVPAKAVPPSIRNAKVKHLNLHAAIECAAKENGIPAALLATVVAIESSSNPCAVSRAGAKGLAQLMDETARHYQVDDPFDPRQNLQGSGRLIRDLLDKNDGRLLQMAAAYNAGEKVLTRSWEHWPTETRDYLGKVLRHYPDFTEDRWKSILPEYVLAANRQICRP